jgi:hypothetical protein
MAKLARSIIDRDLLLDEMVESFPNMEAIKAREFKPSGTRSWEEMLRNYANIQTNKEVELKDSSMIGNAVKYLAKYKGYNPDPQLFNAKGNLTLPEGTEPYQKAQRREGDVVFNDYDNESGGYYSSPAFYKGNVEPDYKGAVQIINRVANTLTPDGSGALMYPGLNKSIAARNQNKVFNPARDQILYVQDESKPFLDIDDLVGLEPRVKAITNSAASRPIHEKARGLLGDSRNIMTQAQQEMYARKKGEVFTEPPEKQSYTTNFVRLYNTGDPLVDVHKIVGGQPVPLFDEAKYRSIGEEFGEDSANRYRNNVLSDIATDGNQIEDRSFMLANPDDVIRRVSSVLPSQTIGSDKVVSKALRTVLQDTLYPDLNRKIGGEYVGARTDNNEVVVVPRRLAQPQSMIGYREDAIPNTMHGDSELLTFRELAKMSLGRKRLLADTNNSFTAGKESFDNAFTIADEVLKNRDTRQREEQNLGKFIKDSVMNDWVIGSEGDEVQYRLADLTDQQIVDERRLAKMGIPDARMFRDSIPATNTEYGIESDTIRKPILSNMNNYRRDVSDNEPL